MQNDNEQEAIILLGWYSITVEAFLRRDFGIEDLNPRSFFGFLGMVVIYYAASSYMIPTRIFGVFILAYIILAIWHQIRSRQLDRNGYWHSGTTGISWLQSLLPDRMGTFVEYWLEPLLFASLGFLMLPFEPVTGFWLMTASIAMSLRTVFIYRSWRFRRRAQRDAVIESTVMHHNIEGGGSSQQYSEIARPAPKTSPVAQDAPDFDRTVRDVMEKRNDRHSAFVAESAAVPMENERNVIDFSRTVQEVMKSPPNQSGGEAV